MFITPGSKPKAGGLLATQADMELATSLRRAVSPGRQANHPAHPKAIYSATITSTAVSGAATSWTSNICLWNAAHGLTSGDVIRLITNAPTGSTVNTCYYAGVVDGTHFSLHLNQLDATTGANKVAISSSVATTIQKWVFTNVISYGMSSTGAVGPAPAANANIGLAFTLSPLLSSAVVLAQLAVSGLVVSAGLLTPTSSVPTPSTIAAGVISYINANIPTVTVSSGALDSPGTWASQSTTAFTVSFVAWGDLP